MVWTAKGIGHGFAGVTLSDGRIYTAGEFQNDTVITALDMDGRVQWRAENGKGRVTASPVGARSTPTIDGNRLYHENAGGQLVCLDTKTGKRIWGLSLATEFQGKGGGFDQSESPLIDGDRVICCPGGATAMVALNKYTGRTVWRSPSVGEPAGYPSPILVSYKGLRMILAVSQFQLIGTNADTGELLWQYKHYRSGPFCICALPVYHDGQVFLTAGYRKGSVLLQIKVDGKKASIEPVWHSTDLDNRQGGVLGFRFFPALAYLSVDDSIRQVCATFNLLEALFWLTVAAGFVAAFYRKRRNGRLMLGAALLLFLFGVSDFVEMKTGAWYRPWWLFGWKAANLVGLVVVFVLLWKQREEPADPSRPALAAPRWVAWLARTACAVLLVGVGVLLFTPVAGIDQETCDSVRAGMTLEEACRLIGGPPGWYDGVEETSSSGPLGRGGRPYWVGSEGQIVVEVDRDGRAVSAAFYPGGATKRSWINLAVERLVIRWFR